MTLFSVVAGTWLIFELEKSQRCLSSLSVRKVVVLMAEGNEKRFPVCQVQEKIGEDEEAQLSKDEQKNLKSEIRLFESLLAFFEAEIYPLQIVWLDGSSDFYQVSERKVVLGRGLLLKKGQLTHALFRAWLLGQAHKSLRLNDLWLETSADFLTAVAQGGLEIESLVPGRWARFEKDWKAHHFFYSLAGLCDSEWRPMSLQPLCIALKKGGEENRVIPSAQKLSVFSLRPIFFHLLWESYKGQSLVERLQFLRGFNQLVRKKEWQSFPTQLDFAQLSLLVTERMIKIYQSLNLAEEDLQVLLRGQALYARSSTPQTLRLGIVSEAKEFTKKEACWTERRQERMALVREHEIDILPLGDILSEPKGVRFHFLVVPRCRGQVTKMARATMRAWQKRVEFIQFLDTCDEVTSWPWPELSEIYQTGQTKK